MKKLILVLLMFFVVPTAQADPYILCVGEITKLMVASDGRLAINTSWQQDPNSVYYLCNTKDEWNSVDLASCLQWYGLAKTAYENHEQIVLQYVTDSYTCSTLPNWSNSLKPAYFALER